MFLYIVKTCERLLQYLFEHNMIRLGHLMQLYAFSYVTP